MGIVLRRPSYRPGAPDVLLARGRCELPDHWALTRCRGWIGGLSTRSGIRAGYGLTSLLKQLNQSIEAGGSHDAVDFTAVLDEYEARNRTDRKLAHQVGALVDIYAADGISSLPQSLERGFHAAARGAPIGTEID